MLYKAKTNLTVGFADRGTKSFEAGKFYKEEDLGPEIDMTNFVGVSETEADREIQARKKPGSSALKNASATPVADLA